MFKCITTVLLFTALLGSSVYAQQEDGIKTSGYVYKGTIKSKVDGSEQALEIAFKGKVQNEYYPVSRYVIGTEEKSLYSFKYTKKDYRSTLISNSNDDYIPGGNSCWNQDIILFVSGNELFGKVVERKYPNCDGSGGSKEESLDRVVDTIINVTHTISLKLHKVSTEEVK